MATKDIIVIGGSAGGLEALRKLIGGLPKDLQASIFIVRHISPYLTEILPEILDKEKTFHAAAIDGEKIEMGRIYVAKPDNHLVVEQNRVRVTKGPKENCFRRASDLLFRSAAYSYCLRVIEVILTGALDDGTAIVQDPAETVTIRIKPNKHLKKSWLN